MNNKLLLSEIKQLIDEVSTWGACEFEICGGEPFLERNLFKICKYANAKGLGIALPSNGSLITRSAANKLKKCGVRGVQINIHGCSSETHDKICGLPGAFEQARNAIRNLVTAGLLVSAVTVVSKENINEIEEIIKLVQEDGVIMYRVLHMLKIGRAIFSGYQKKALDLTETWRLYDKIEKIKKEIKKNNFWIRCEIPFEFIKDKEEPLPITDIVLRRCGGGFRRMDIAPDGTVYPCEFFYNLPEFIVGNIRDQHPLELWNNSKIFKKFRKIPDKLEGKCKRCKYINSCVGGCRAYALIHGGDFYSPDPRCPYDPVEDKLTIPYTW